MTTFNFSTDNNNYQVGTLFSMVYNKRNDNYNIVRFGTIASVNDLNDVINNIDIIETFANLLNECKKERSIANQIVLGFNAVRDNGTFGNLPTEARSTFFSALKNATENTIFAVVGVTESEETKGVFHIEYIPLFASEISLLKTNLGMSKRFFESCRTFKHLKQWKKAANVTLLQGSIKSYITAVRNNTSDEFLAPYLDTLANIEIKNETETAIA